MPEVSFHPLAKQELIEASQYYDLENPGLGNAFLTEAERCVEAIVRHPGSGMAIHGAIRRLLIHRFPYGVLYTAQADEILVIAVMNLRRRPAYWSDRLNT